MQQDQSQKLFWARRIARPHECIGPIKDAQYKPGIYMSQEVRVGTIVACVGDMYYYDPNMDMPGAKKHFVKSTSRHELGRMTWIEIIEKSVHDNRVEIKHEVKFVWDEGDPSVGLYACWGEDTGAWTTFGDTTKPHFRIYWEFVVGEDVVPYKWQLTDVQLQHVFAPSLPHERGWIHLADASKSRYDIREAHPHRIKRQTSSDTPRATESRIYASVSIVPPMYERIGYASRPLLLGDIPEVADAVCVEWHKIERAQRESQAEESMNQEWIDESE